MRFPVLSPMEIREPEETSLDSSMEMLRAVQADIN